MWQVKGSLEDSNNIFVYLCIISTAEKMDRQMKTFLFVQVTTIL